MHRIAGLLIVIGVLTGGAASPCNGEEVTPASMTLSNMKALGNSEEGKAGRINSYGSIIFSSGGQVMVATCSRLSKRRNIRPSDFSSEVQVFQVGEQYSLRKVVPLADKSGGLFLPASKQDEVLYISSQRKKPAEHQVDILSTESKVPLATFEYPGTTAHPFAMNWNQRLFAICGTTAEDDHSIDAERTISLWDVNTRKGKARFSVGKTLVTEIAFSPDGTKLAVVGTLFTKEMVPFQLSPDELPRQIETTKKQGILHLWDLVSNELIYRKTLPDYHLDSTAFSTDGKALAIGGIDGTKKVKEGVLGWDLVVTDSIGKIMWIDIESAEWRVTAELEMPRPARSPKEKLGTARIECLAFSSDGRFLASGIGSWNRGGKWGGIRIIDNESHKVISVVLEKHPQVVTCVAFSPDGTELAAGTADGVLKVWDITKIMEPPD